MIELHFCRTCYENQGLSISTIEHNGHQGKCIYCGTPMVRHECSNRNGLGNASWVIPQQIWLPLMTPFISAACPGCGLAIKLGEQLESLPGIPAEVKEFASDLIKAGVIVGVVFLIADIFKSLGKKRS